jgi:hypothetical protein
MGVDRVAEFGGLIRCRMASATVLMSSWSPLVGHPLVRRTWAAWPANSHRRDLGHLVAALERPVRVGPRA